MTYKKYRKYDRNTVKEFILHLVTNGWLEEGLDYMKIMDEIHERREPR